MIYGYARVSTKEQNPERQLIALAEYGVSHKNLFIDKQSGKNFERTKYKQLIRKIKKDDIIVVKSIDRLGRNYREILEQWRIITQVKKADIAVVDMPLLDTAKNKDLMGTFVADLVLQVLSFVSETERENIRQRQAEGISAAKAKGVKFGREKKFYAENYISVFTMYSKKQITRAQAEEIIGCRKNTFYKMLRELREAGKIE